MKTKAELIALLKTFLDVRPSGLSDWKIEARRALNTVAQFPNATCAECGLPYEEFPIDMVLPLEQWVMVSPKPDGSGVLCAGCIVLRASRLPHIIAAKTTLEFAKAAYGAAKNTKEREAVERNHANKRLNRSTQAV